MTRYVAIECEGAVQVHASPTAGNSYATLCALDGNDSVVEQRMAPLDIGARINCPQCISIIRHAKTFRTKDFAR